VHMCATHRYSVTVVARGCHRIAQCSHVLYLISSFLDAIASVCGDRRSPNTHTYALPASGVVGSNEFTVTISDGVTTATSAAFTVVGACSTQG